jgi:hypothetical protein
VLSDLKQIEASRPTLPCRDLGWDANRRSTSCLELGHSHSCPARAHLVHVGIRSSHFFRLCRPMLSASSDLPGHCCLQFKQPVFPLSFCRNIRALMSARIGPTTPHHTGSKLMDSHALIVTARVAGIVRDDMSHKRPGSLIMGWCFLKYFELAVTCPTKTRWRRWRSNDGKMVTIRRRVR